MKTKYARNTPETVIMTITPQIAKEMLDTSSGNRSINTKHVRNLAGALERGEWHITSQGIGFDKEGHLRDGHHRLNACIKVNTPFVSTVVLGMLPSAYEVTDIGSKRAYADRLNEPPKLTEIYTLAYSVMSGWKTPTTAQLRPLIDSGLGGIAKGLLKNCPTPRKTFSSAGVKLAACVAILHGEDPGFVIGQYRALCTLDFDSMTPASQAFVRFATSNANGRHIAKELLTRAMVVFKVARQNTVLSRIKEGDIADALIEARVVLRQTVENHYGIEWATRYFLGEVTEPPEPVSGKF